MLTTEHLVELWFCGCPAAVETGAHREQVAHLDRILWVRARGRRREVGKEGEHWLVEREEILVDCDADQCRGHTLGDRRRVMRLTIFSTMSASASESNPFASGESLGHAPAGAPELESQPEQPASASTTPSVN